MDLTFGFSSLLLLVLAAAMVGFALGRWTSDRRTRGWVSPQVAAARAREQQSALERDLAAAGAELQAVRRHVAERDADAAVENSVLQQLAPITRQLDQMRAALETLEHQRSTQHGQLAEQLRSTHAVAEQSRSVAQALSSALRDNGVRGGYGEVQLRRIVEAAGLVHRVDFHLQASVTTDAGARRPDLVVQLPGQRYLAVDAKAPFAAFLDSTDAALDAQRRDALRRQHAKAVRSHIVELSRKEYWTGLPSSPDFTVAFIPNDAIVQAAIEADPALLDYAFGQGIVLASPSTLWALLRTVAFVWRQEQLTEHAQHVVDLARELHKRLGTYADHMAKLGRSIDRTVADYNKVVGSWERQVLVTARKLEAVDDAAPLTEIVNLESRTTPLLPDSLDEQARHWG